ncbi:MAG: 16S rRNA (cytosine(1402)-N(4))-methyltransferase RsmH [Candidatus Eisenbacteria bacterium]
MGSRHEPAHRPVMVVEVLRHLRGGPGWYLDATLGDGGHAAALLDAEPGARLLGTDRDPESLAVARVALARFGERVVIERARFAELPAVHARLGSTRFTGAMLDLGLSSRQIDTTGRGMSFMRDEPLDLRMDATTGEPAHRMLERVTEDALETVLRVHGDLREAGRLARALVAAARAGSLRTTGALVAVVDRALGGRPHPRRHAQVFQALRIWVNDEMSDLETMLDWLPGAMAPGGVVVTLAYHSGEDRRIKQALRGRPPRIPRRLLPLVTESESDRPWRELSRRVELPTDTEVAANPRARSARLRAFRRNSA